MRFVVGWHRQEEQSMAVQFNIEVTWPELFEELSALDRVAVVQTLASSWHEGWVPNREDVADLIDVTRGVIDEAEYDARTRAKVERERAERAAGADTVG
jgi:hypothetical protein